MSSNFLDKLPNTATHLSDPKPYARSSPSFGYAGATLEPKDSLEIAIIHESEAGGERGTDGGGASPVTLYVSKAIPSAI